MSSYEAVEKLFNKLRRRYQVDQSYLLKDKDGVIRRIDKGEVAEALRIEAGGCGLMAGTVFGVGFDVIAELLRQLDRFSLGSRYKATPETVRQAFQDCDDGVRVIFKGGRVGSMYTVDLDARRVTEARPIAGLGDVKVTTSADRRCAVRRQEKFDRRSSWTLKHLVGVPWRHPCGAQHPTPHSAYVYPILRSTYCPDCGQRRTDQFDRRKDPMRRNPFGDAGRRAGDK